jgi:arabinose-5-phosphate isomerase
MVSILPMRTTNDQERVLSEGKAVLHAASSALARLANELGAPFTDAARRILDCKGQLVCTGIGKAGHIALKASATFASTGTLSIFLHPTEAVHGDLGRVRAQDVVLVFSNSGTSAELVRLVQPLRSIGATLVVVTGKASSPLGAEADVCLCYGDVEDAGHLGLAPTTSTTVMLALGDALAMAVLQARGFSPAEFARYHPGGALGRSLLRVGDIMRKGDASPRVLPTTPLAQVLHEMTRAPGRPGAVSVVDAGDLLVGFYTDGDFRRNMEAAQSDDDFSFLKRPISEFMTRNPKSARADDLVGEAMRLLREKKIDQVPVVDERGVLVGLVDVQDLLDVKVVG